MLSTDRKSRVVRTLLSAGIALLGCLTGASADTVVGEPVVVAVAELGETRSLDLVVERGVIHGLLAGRFGERERVVYLHSADGGKTWSEPAFLNEEDEAPVISRRGNDARRRSRSSSSPSGRSGRIAGHWSLAVAASADGGRTWRRGRNPALGDPFNNQSYPALAAGEDGCFHLVWLDDREENGNTQGCAMRRLPTDCTDRQTTLDPAVCTVADPISALLIEASRCCMRRRSARHAPLGPLNNGRWLISDR